MTPTAKEYGYVATGHALTVDLVHGQQQIADEYLVAQRASFANGVHDGHDPAGIVEHDAKLSLRRNYRDEIEVGVGESEMCLVDIFQRHARADGHGRFARMDGRAFRSTFKLRVILPPRRKAVNI